MNELKENPLYSISNPPLYNSSEDFHQTQSNFPVIKVAVVDEGTDFNHPYLQPNILTKKNENGINVVDGFDAMADDDNPHPYNLNLALFHFKSNNSKNNTSHYSTAAPLEDLSQLNNEFIQFISHAINSNPIFEQSLFKKNINYHSINILGLANIYLKELSKDLSGKKIFSEYSSVVPSNLISQKSEFNSDLEILDLKSNNIRELEYIKNFQWLVNDNGMPLLMLDTDKQIIENNHYAYYLKNFLGFKELIEIFKQYTSTKSFQILIEKLNNYRIFRLDSKVKANERSQEYNNEMILALKYLTQSFQRYIYPSRYLYSMEFIDGIKDLGIENLNICLNLDQENNQYLFPPHLNKQTNDQFQIMPLIQQLDQLFKNNNSENKKIFDLLKCSNKYYEINSQSQNAYLSGLVPLHGTHVAGLINQFISLEDNIKIIPIKIPLGTVIYPSEILENGYETFLDMASEYLKGKESFYLNEPTIPRVQFMKSFKKLLSSHLPMSFFKLINVFNYLKIQNVSAVNFSFGTVFEMTNFIEQVELAAKIDNENAKSKVAFFFIEFIKSFLRTQINNLPETLFFISAGNDGKAVDGHSMSVLPCDLSASKMLVNLGFPSEKSPDNIICIQSSGPEIRNQQYSFSPTSSFSNRINGELYVINTNGEMQLSSVLPYEVKSTIDQFEKKFNQFLSDFAIKKSITNTLDEKKLAYLKHLYQNFSLNIEQNKFSNDQIRNNYAKFSGTSMAAPLTLGYFIKSYSQFIKASSDQVISPKKFFQQYFVNENNDYLKKNNLNKLEFVLSDEKISSNISNPITDYFEAN